LPNNAPDRQAAPTSVHEAPEQSPGFLLWRTTLLWQRQIRGTLAPHDLTHVQFVLLASAWWLEEHEGPPTQTRVAQHAATDPMMTSQVLRRLEAGNLVTREADPTDTRARRITLTTAGRSRLAKALADVEAADREFFAALGTHQPMFIAHLDTLGADAIRTGASPS
jgi:DNA-binding MarR family transcriptional regulator